MIKRLIVFIIIGAVIPAFAFGEVSGSELPHIYLNPDSPFYFLKTIKEQIQLFFTFSAEKKVEQYLNLAERRLAEYQKMVEKGKTEIAEKTLSQYENWLNHAFKKLEELKNQGKNINDSYQKVEELISKHLEIIQKNLTQVPEAAKKELEKAIETLNKLLENVFKAENKKSIQPAESKFDNESLKQIQQNNVSVFVQNDGKEIAITQDGKNLAIISASSMPFKYYGKFSETPLSAKFKAAWVIPHHNKILFEYWYPGTEAQNVLDYFGVSDFKGENLHFLNNSENVEEVIFSPSGKYFSYLSGFSNGICYSGVGVKLYDIENEKELNVPEKVSGRYLENNKNIYNVISHILWQQKGEKEFLLLTDSPYRCDDLATKEIKLNPKSYILSVPEMELKEQQFDTSTY